MNTGRTDGCRRKHLHVSLPRPCSTVLLSQYIQTFMNKTWLERTGAPLESGMVLMLWSFTVSVYPLGGLAGAVAAGPMAIVLGR